MMEKEQKEALESHLKEQIAILKKDIVSYKELTKPVGCITH